MKAAQYQIKVKGELDPTLSAWFGDFSITHTPNGDTLLTGSALDQAALHGVLARCRDLGMMLISINPVISTTDFNTDEGKGKTMIKTQRITTNVQALNVKTRVIQQGEGTPTLMLHGIPDSAEMWQGLMDHLPPNLWCIAPDLPGFGYSIIEGRYQPSLDRMAEWVNALVDALHITEPLNLIMTDLGGTYGLAWAVRHPERVRQMALVGGINFFSDYKWHSMARMLRTPLLGEIAMAAINFDNFRTSMRQTNGVIAALTDDKLRHIYDLSFAKPSVRQMTLSHYRALDSWKFAAWEPGLQALTARVPMIILWGDRDPYIAPAYADRFGATQVEHFADYGHWFAIEAPEVIANRLIRFFN